MLPHQAAAAGQGAPNLPFEVLDLVEVAAPVQQALGRPRARRNPIVSCADPRELTVKSHVRPSGATVVVAMLAQLM
jgi:hypothetical protein